MTSPARHAIAGAALLAVATVFFALGPWNTSPDAKLRSVLLAFDGLQASLERQCGTTMLQPGTLSYQQTGIPDTTVVDKRLPGLSVKVSVEVPETATMLLTVTLPELSGDGIHMTADPIPAGATLRSRGRCDGGTVFWTRLESTLPKERLRAALDAGMR